MKIDLSLYLHQLRDIPGRVQPATPHFSIQNSCPCPGTPKMASAGILTF